MRHATVSIAAAVGIPDDRLGERVCLVVSPADEGGVDKVTLLAHPADGGLSRFDMPEHAVEVGEPPLTASGKIRKKVLVEMLLNGHRDPQQVGVK
jgi:non-ribosomal peptide synthetase component E (peptide arylation enzyme)